MNDKTGVVLAKAIQQKGENELEVKGVLKKGDRAEIHDLPSEKLVQAVASTFCFLFCPMRMVPCPQVVEIYRPHQAYQMDGRRRSTTILTLRIPRRSGAVTYASTASMASTRTSPPPSRRFGYIAVFPSSASLGALLVTRRLSADHLLYCTYCMYNKTRRLAPSTTQPSTPVMHDWLRCSRKA